MGFIHRAVGFGSCLTWLLELVGNDAPHEVWMSAVQCGHQLVQLLLRGGKASKANVRRSTHARTH